MNLSIGIVGLPNVGKSTLFNALLKRQAALAANYPFATIEPNIGVVDVPDERLKILEEVVRNDFGQKLGTREVPEKTIPAVVKFYDIAGLVKGAHKGEGLGNQFLSHIREVSAIVHVVRAFTDENVIRAESTEPVSDADTINTELILADMESLSKRIEKMSASAKRVDAKEEKKKLAVYEKIAVTLNNGEFASKTALNDIEFQLTSDLHLLTMKPVIYALNVDEAVISKGNFDELVSNFTQNAPSKHNPVFNIGENTLIISAKIESELAQLEELERMEYMKELNIEMSGLDAVIKKSYDILGLQTYFTAGPKEVRAWTIKKGFLAPQAAGVIHTDFERGFISAEVVSFKDIQNTLSKKVAKEKGLIRIEGKNYTMQEGDVVEFRFSV